MVSAVDSGAIAAPAVRKGKAAVVPATEAMLPGILELLRGFGNGRMREADWLRMLVRHGWDEPGDGFGFALVDGERVVGFIGTLYSTRVLDGRPEKLCNLAGWIVRPEYRLEALGLLRRALSRPGVTYTGLTLIEASARIFRRFGFVTLEEHAWILPPLATPGGWRRCRVLVGPERIAPRLSGEPRALLEAHREAACTHLLLEADGRQCYLVSTRVRLWRLGLSQIHYLSDEEFFWRHSQSARWALLRAHRTPLTLIDSRQVRAHPPLALRVRLPQPRLYRPAHPGLRPEQIDGLFTELANLKW